MTMLFLLFLFYPRNSPFKFCQNGVSNRWIFGFVVVVVIVVAVVVIVVVVVHIVGFVIVVVDPTNLPLKFG